ncbi:LysE family translocator [Pseudomonas corrugata]
MTPGPSFVAVVHKAVSGPRTDAIAFVMGIVAVNLVWATCAIFGIGMVFKLFPWLAAAVKIAGAAYLVWFGLRLIIASRTASAKPQMKPKSTGFRAAFFQGAAMNAMNPKSIAFFAAVFSSAAPAHVSTATFLRCLRRSAPRLCAGTDWSRSSCRMRPLPRPTKTPKELSTASVVCFLSGLAYARSSVERRARALRFSASVSAVPRRVLEFVSSCRYM